MTVFVAVFKLVSSAITQTSSSKLSKFECFMLTLMKLQLDLCNFDLEF